ncbi:MAG: sigma-54 dependent transcriptional regulator [Acidobacteriia bacterium]|nr:sigma-54 dependent transcriptional regulator [Terriglobia bacterium]
MKRERVLFIDLGQRTCSGGNCGVLSSRVGRWLESECLSATTPKQASQPPHLVILRTLGIERLLESLRTLRANWKHVPILGVLCGASNTPGQLLECFAEGLDDFVECPVRETDIVVRSRRLMLNTKLNEQASPLPNSRLHLDFLVGESEPFLRLLAKVPQIARSMMTVLLTGETGTGKELFARAIHYSSPRKGHPFIPVNCGGLPDHLLENELFGHARGAYTDAHSSHGGLLSVAEGGTLFLDEIDALSLSAQVKLLRFLQDHEYRPLGSSTTVTADIRIIAATNANLRELVQAHRFREDLFHRLNVLHLVIPPLHERLDDVPLFAGHFLLKIAKQEGLEAKTLTLAGLRKLQNYSWPGNVRELEGVIQRAVVMSTGSVIDAEDLELPTDASSSSAAAVPMVRSLREIKNQIIVKFERAEIVSLLLAHHGNLSRAAREAGTNRRTLQRLMRKYELQRMQFETR